MAGPEPAAVALRAAAPVHLAWLPDAAQVNAAILARYLVLRDHPSTRRSHACAGRYENTYVERQRIPELAPVSAAAETLAATLTGRRTLRWGCWFNEMHPGDLTTLHSHDEADELLSCVYYVTAPPQAGRLELHDDPLRHYVTPEPGLFVFFPPDLPHAVEAHRGRDLRLSVAYNFGPPGPTP